MGGGVREPCRSNPTNTLRELMVAGGERAQVRPELRDLRPKPDHLRKMHTHETDACST